MKFISKLIALTSVVVTPFSSAALTGYWPLDTESSGVSPNLAVGGTDATFSGIGLSIVNDGTRGLVLQSTGVAGAYASAGTLPDFTDLNNFTWVFFADSADNGGTDVILGNRGGTAGNTTWAKFTESAFEWRTNGVTKLVDYDNLISSTSWNHHAVVKEGLNLNYYRNGAYVMTTAIPAGQADTMPSLPLYFMGDATFGENFAGRLDDVAVFDHALTASDIAGLSDGTLTPLTVPEPSIGALLAAGTSLWVGLRRNRKPAAHV